MSHNIGVLEGTSEPTRGLNFGGVGHHGIRSPFKLWKNEENPMYRLKLLTEVLGVQLERNASNPDVLTNRASRVNQYGPSDDGTSLSPFARDPIEAGSLAGGVLRSHRNVCGSPFKTLDAPDLKNDFYVNPVDWSSSDLLAISLGTTIYLWNATTQEVSRLCDLAVHHDDVSSVAWSRSSGYLAVGTQRGLIQLWDPNEKKKIRDIEEHWVGLGSFDGVPTLWRREWSPDNILLASGGNDNVVNVWDVRGTHRPEWVISGHNAAVKALAWSPHNTRRLASGGGLSDTTIRIWNVSSHKCLHHKDAGAQVCGLHWSKNCNEIVSTHGYNTSSIKLWKCLSKHHTPNGRSGVESREGSENIDGSLAGNNRVCSKCKRESSGTDGDDVESRGNSSIGKEGSEGSGESLSKNRVTYDDCKSNQEVERKSGKELEPKQCGGPDSTEMVEESMEKKLDVVEILKNRPLTDADGIISALLARCRQKMKLEEDFILDDTWLFRPRKNAPRKTFCTDLIP
ncbi:hypothetical protein BSKO_05906 [Bryopsis sp. KO-2023]|nr:hypothetical protein BSKO_05906 [Bryopsis sp. KO-2023]